MTPFLNEIGVFCLGYPDETCKMLWLQVLASYLDFAEVKDGKA
jgi:hypothetical protein